MALWLSFPRGWLQLSPPPFSCSRLACHVSMLRHIRRLLHRVQDDHVMFDTADIHQNFGVCHKRNKSLGVQLREDLLPHRKNGLVPSRQIQWALHCNYKGKAQRLLNVNRLVHSKKHNYSKNHINQHRCGSHSELFSRKKILCRDFLGSYGLFCHMLFVLRP